MSEWIKVIVSIAFYTISCTVLYISYDCNATNWQWWVIVFSIIIGVNLQDNVKNSKNK